MLSQTLYHQAQSMQPSSAAGANNQAAPISEDACRKTLGEFPAVGIINHVSNPNIITLAWRDTTLTREQHLRAQLELLKSHDVPPLSSPSSINPREPRNPPIQPAPSRPSNGYEGLTSGPLETARAIIAKASVDAHIHPDLRTHPHHAQSANMMPIAPPTGHEPGAISGPSAAAIAPAPLPPLSMDDPNDGRKAKRELSQSKRAAQNRAAQRAFRQRKEGYIKKLEQQVRELAEMENSYKVLDAENRALRDYAVTCQSRLMEVTGEFPPPPPNVNLSQPPPPPPPGPPANAPEPPPNNAAVGTPLEAVAQAVAGLAAHEQMTERQSYPSPTFRPEQGTEDTRTADEINRHLQDDAGSVSAL